MDHYERYEDGSHEEVECGMCGVKGVPLIVLGWDQVDDLSGTHDICPDCGDKMKSDYQYDFSDKMKSDYPYDFSDIKGQTKVIENIVNKMCLNPWKPLMFVGPPGSGGAMIAKRLATILPEDRSVEEQRLALYRMVFGEECTYRQAAVPFRAPHHTISSVGILGKFERGKLQPGEFMLAGGGVLFLDEATEFRTFVLRDVQGQIDNGVNVRWKSMEFRWDVKVQLVLEVQPCFCGWYEMNGSKNCTCDERTRRAWQKQTRMIQDFFDAIPIKMNPPSWEDLKTADVAPSSWELKQKLKKAWSRR